MKVRISRSARKHKLRAGRIRQPLVNATLVREEADAAMYVGTDDEGLEIELVIVADDRSDDGVHRHPRDADDLEAAMSTFPKQVGVGVAAGRQWRPAGERRRGGGGATRSAP